MFDPSKGGSSPLAQAFLQNKATQPAAQLPTIEQPVQRPLPQVQMPQQPQQQQPVMGSMAPGMSFADTLDPRKGSKAERFAGALGLLTGRPIGAGQQQHPVQQQQQATPQKSQAQLLAEAINAQYRR